MTEAIKHLWDGYQYYFHELTDPRAAHFPLVNNPIEILLIIGVYLKIVLDWGPKFMKNREPFDLKYVLMVYNIFQICINAYIVYLTTRYAFIQSRYNFICEPVDYSNDPNSIAILHATYIYYISKICDLFETVFFVLRKKWKQVSFLHLFHHSVMCIIGYIGANYIPGGNTIFPGSMNSFVHVVMYVYYLLSSISKPGKMLWWKKHVTQLQMVQLLLIVTHALGLVLHPGCGYPKLIALIIFPSNLAFLALFSNFYYHAYIKVKSV